MNLSENINTKVANTKSGPLGSWIELETPTIVVLWGIVEDDYCSSSFNTVTLNVTVEVDRNGKSYEEAFCLTADEDTKEGNILRTLESGDGVAVLGCIIDDGLVEVFEVIATDRYDDNMEWYRTIVNPEKYARDVKKAEKEWTMFNFLEPIYRRMEFESRNRDSVGEYDIDNAMNEIAEEEGAEDASFFYLGELWLMKYSVYVD